MKEVTKVLNKVTAVRCTNGRIKTAQSQCMTIVGIMTKDRNKIGIGISVCDEQDEFSEKLGHEIARGRALDALRYSRGKTFQRPDVIADFAHCGLNITGVRRLPKSIFITHGQANLSEYNSLKILKAKPSVMKALELDWDK